MKVEFLFLLEIQFTNFFLDIELIEPKTESQFEIEMKKIFGLIHSSSDEKDNFNIIINVLTKILMVFGKQPFLERSKIDPLFLFIYQKWLQQLDYDQHQNNIPILLNGWSSILTQWLKLDYQNQEIYFKQIPENQLDNNDDEIDF